MRPRSIVIKEIKLIFIFFTINMDIINKIKIVNSEIQKVIAWVTDIEDKLNPRAIK